MIVCLTETNTSVVAKPLVIIMLNQLNYKFIFLGLYCLSMKVETSTKYLVTRPFSIKQICKYKKTVANALMNHDHLYM